LKDTVKCLDSLKKITYPNYEAIVVDNGSKSNDADVLEKEYGDYIKVIRNKENLGFAGGNNVAVRKILKAGKSDYVLLLNNDTVVEPNFLTELIKVAENDSKVGMDTPKLLNPDGSLQQSVREFPTPFVVFLSFCVPKFFKKIASQTALKKFFGKKVDSYFQAFEGEEPVEIDNASGACLLARMETIRQVGILDEKFFLSSEDVDWCYRVKKAGWKIVYVPKAKMTHFVSKSFKNKAAEHFYFCHKVASKHYYAKKHYNKIDILKIRLTLLFALIMKSPFIIYYSLFKEQGKKFNLGNLYKNSINRVFFNKMP